MGNSHKHKFNMGHIGNIEVYIERTFKYLHFACGTLKKMSNTLSKNVPMFENLFFSNMGTFFGLCIGSPSKMATSISFGSSFYLG